MYRRRVRKRGYRSRYRARDSGFLFSPSRYRRQIDLFTRGEARRAFGKARQKAKVSVARGNLRFPGQRKKSNETWRPYESDSKSTFLRGGKGPSYKSTQLAHHAIESYKEAGMPAHAWKKNWDWQKGRTLEMGPSGNKYPLPDDYSLQRYAEWLYYPVMAGLKAKAYVESMPYTGDPSPRDEL